MNTLTPEHLNTLGAAGLTPEATAHIGQLLIGCGGFVKELIRHSGGASTTKTVDVDQRLSAADELVDTLVREELLRLFPQSRGYSEEGGWFGKPADGLQIHWLLDPVDGTRPALLGGAFAVSLGALVLDGDTPLAAFGWVYVPTLGALYYGSLCGDQHVCLLNGQPVAVERGLTQETLHRRYLASESNWHEVCPTPLPFKLSAAGSTAVNLTRVVHPDSDIPAAALTHCRPYDAAGGLPVAVAGGARIYPLTADGRPDPQELAPLPFLHRGAKTPDQYGPHVLVCSPEVAALLRA